MATTGSAAARGALHVRRLTSQVRLPPSDRPLTPASTGAEAQQLGNAVRTAGCIAHHAPAGQSTARCCALSFRWIAADQQTEVQVCCRIVRHAVVTPMDGAQCSGYTGPVTAVASCRQYVQGHHADVRNGTVCRSCCISLPPLHCGTCHSAQPVSPSLWNCPSSPHQNSSPGVPL